MTERPTGTVTFLFTDIERSTALWEHHPDAMGGALARHDALMRAAITEHGGYVVKTMGDAFHAAFSRAPDALAAVVDGQRRLEDEPWGNVGPLRVRMALHTGAAEERDGDYYGPTLNRAARILAAGHGGQILLSQSTAELAHDGLPDDWSLRDLGQHRLRDVIRPERISQLVVPGLPADFPPLRTVDARPHNLPAQATRLVGREPDVMAACERLLSPDVRLLTMTGPGGTGKTRLALRVAADLLDHASAGSGSVPSAAREHAFPDGVFFVALSPIGEAAMVAPSIAQALGVRDEGGGGLVETLKSHLRDKRLLLVLDNFEQVVAASPLVAELLAAASGLKVLVTSRIVLRVYGEHDFPVSPLAFPDPRRLPSTSGLSLYPAIALWIERAQAVKPDFVLTDENVQAVTEICARLDGLPLAIELAAARARLLSPDAMLARLHRRLPLLTQGSRDLPIRQQTLRGSIAWSYDLLDEAERALFVRLGVFAGGFTLEAAEAVGAVGGDLAIDVMDGTASLIDKSLLRQETQSDGEPRFVMLETIREYALEQLEAHGEAATARRRHAEYYAGLAEQAEPELHGSHQVAWFERLEREHDNVRSALGWCIESGEAELGPRLGGAVWLLWALRGHITEGREWLDRLLSLRGTSTLTAAPAKVLTGAGLLAWTVGDFVAARTRLEEGITLWRGLGDRPGLAYALGLLGLVHWSQGEPQVGRSLWDESLVLFREAGVMWGVALMLGSFGRAALYRGDLEEAASYLEQAAAIRPAVGDTWVIAQTLNSQGDLERLRGDYRAAQVYYEESLALVEEMSGKITIAGLLQNLGHLAMRQSDYRRAAERFGDGLGMFRELGDRPGMATCLIGLAGVAGAESQFAQAARLLGAAERLREEAGASLTADDRATHAQIEGTARAELGAEAFATAWSEGRAQPMSYG